MNANIILEQRVEDSPYLLQQLIDLQKKYYFQLLQNNRLLKQNKQLKHELKIIYALNKLEFSEHCKSLNLLMQLILSPVTLCSNLIAEDWEQLFICMDILYGDTLKKWLAKHNSLSKEEIALCYFCYIGIRHTNLAIFWGIAPQSLSKRKQRLKNKLKISQFRYLTDTIEIL